MTASRVLIETCGETVVSYATPGQLMDRDLERLMSACTAHGVKKYLSYSEGVIMVNAEQRSRSKALLGREVIAIIDNPILRGVATVLSWFGVSVRVFPPSRIEEAIHDLGLNDHESATVTMTLGRLKAASLAKVAS